jgi:hypothetical protein
MAPAAARGNVAASRRGQARAVTLDATRSSRRTVDAADSDER